MKIHFAALALLFAGSASAEVPLGTYSTVSESEWALYVELKKGGAAEVRHESWNAGEYDKKDTTRIRAKWSATGSRVTVSYDGVTDVFDYTPALSLEELGLEGGAPGLKQITPIDKGSRIVGHSLWREPHNFGRHD